MQSVNLIIMGITLLFLLSIMASMISPRLGVPLLLVFLVIGMLAGENGPGNIPFDNIGMAYVIGTLALAVILFDGGLRTNIDNFRVGLRPALSLATLGVTISSLICGLIAAWVLDLSILEGLLIGAIVGSTDAAAVFSILNMQGLTLKSRVGATLEIESGINDPMAIFLTLTLISLILSDTRIGFLSLAGSFVWQMGMGAVVGIVCGRLLARGITHLSLSPGLYPLLALFGGVFTFALATQFGASGFLAIYLAGLMVGRHVGSGIYSIERFHDGVAWLAQISMFLILGMLVTPAELIPFAPGALLVGLLLIMVARPVAVWLCLLPFRFTWQETLFIAWVGLRGAVPIVLAMFPWDAGMEQWRSFFNVAFVIVLMSLLLQGWTVTPLAKRLGLNIPTTSARVQRVEMGIPGQEELEFVGYRLVKDNPLLGHSLVAVPLPEGCRLLCVLRDGRILDGDPGSLQLEAGDYLYLLAPTALVPELDRVLVRDATADWLASQAFFGEFVLNPRARLRDLGELYNFEVPPEQENWSVTRLIFNRYRQPVIGDNVRCGKGECVVREMDATRILKVSLKLPH